MSALTVVGLGLTLGAGLALVVTGAPPMRRVSLAERVEAHLVGGTGSSRLLDDDRAVTPWPTLERLLAPGLRSLLANAEPWLGDSGGVARRLDRLGGGTSLQQYRLEQLGWAAGGATAALVLVALLAGRDGFPGLVPTVALVTLGAVAGGLARDRRLGTQVARRKELMRAELPTVAELLALSVAAGEGTTAALDRVSRIGSGALVAELRRVLADTRSGTSLVSALQTLAERVDLPELDRFVAALVVAVERGTPLSPVLQAQASDARESGRRALIEAGGRKEIAMMVPVVFLVLPVSVLFALFPGFYGLTLTSP
jgi:tight adherence protein C